MGDLVNDIGKGLNLKVNRMLEVFNLVQNYWSQRYHYMATLIDLI